MQVHKVQGVFSGVWSFILNSLGASPDAQFSQVFQEAIDLGRGPAVL